MRWKKARRPPCRAGGAATSARAAASASAAGSASAAASVSAPSRAGRPPEGSNNARARSSGAVRRRRPRCTSGYPPAVLPPAQDLPVLRPERPEDRLQGREAAAALHLRAGQDRTEPNHGSVGQEAARTGSGHQARPLPRPPALYGEVGRRPDDGESGAPARHHRRAGRRAAVRGDADRQPGRHDSVLDGAAAAVRRRSAPGPATRRGRRPRRDDRSGNRRPVPRAGLCEHGRAAGPGADQSGTGHTTGAGRECTRPRLDRVGLGRVCTRLLLRSRSGWRAAGGGDGGRARDGRSNRRAIPGGAEDSGGIARWNRALDAGLLRRGVPGDLRRQRDAGAGAARPVRRRAGAAAGDGEHRRAALGGYRVRRGRGGRGRGVGRDRICRLEPRPDSVGAAPVRRPRRRPRTARPASGASGLAGHILWRDFGTRVYGRSGCDPGFDRTMGRAAAAFRWRIGPGRRMMVDVILLQRVENLGQMGQVVKVRPGYARNFLLPQKKALRATKDNLKYFELQRVQLEANNLHLRSEAEQVAAKMAGLAVVMLRQAGETGQLYGSVSGRDVAEAISATGFTIERSQVALGHAIKTLGLHSVKVALHPEVSLQVTVNVAQSADEAAAQARGLSPAQIAAAADAEEAEEPVEEEAGEEE